MFPIRLRLTVLLVAEITSTDQGQASSMTKPSTRRIIRKIRLQWILIVSAPMPIPPTGLNSRELPPIMRSLAPRRESLLICRLLLTTREAMFHFRAQPPTKHSSNRMHWSLLPRVPVPATRKTQLSSKGSPTTKQ